MALLPYGTRLAAISAYTGAESERDLPAPKEPSPHLDASSIRMMAHVKPGYYGEAAGDRPMKPGVAISQGRSDQQKQSQYEFEIQVCIPL